MEYLGKKIPKCLITPWKSGIRLNPAQDSETFAQKKRERGYLFRDRAPYLWAKPSIPRAALDAAEENPEPEPTPTEPEQPAVAEPEPTLVETPIYKTPIHEGTCRLRKDDRYWQYRRFGAINRRGDPEVFMSKRPEYLGDFSNPFEVNAYYNEMLSLGFGPKAVAAAFELDPVSSVDVHRTRIEKLSKELVEWNTPE